jgi:hypothetical protein
MTDDPQVDKAARAVVAAMALIGGALVLRFVVDTEWWLAVAMAVALASFYLIAPDTHRGRLANAVSVAVFTGLGAWGLLDLGAWSALAGAFVASLFLGYYRVVDLRTHRS